MNSIKIQGIVLSILILTACSDTGVDSSNVFANAENEVITGDTEHNEPETNIPVNNDPETNIPVDNDTTNIDVERGGVLYGKLCSSCHGSDGVGETPILGSLGRPDLIEYIVEEMPFGSSQNCNEMCANYINTWMEETWLGEDDPNTSSDADIPSDPIQPDNVTQPKEPDVILSGDGENLYIAQCVSCHGIDGKGNTPITASLQREDLVSYLVNTMPYGAPASCGQDCSEEIANWMSATFENEGQASSIVIPVIEPEEVLAKVSNKQAFSALNATSLNLVGRLPTNAEYQEVAANGSLALSEILDTQMKEDAFLERMRTVFTDLLLLGGSSDGFHSYMRNFSWKSFDNADSEWPKDFKGVSDYVGIRRDTSDGHAHSPYELIKYVIKNDRPFSEILTADYAMLNWYSAKSYGLEHTANFRDLPFDEQKNNDFPKDPTHFLPVYLPKVPSAGLLTTGVYMLDYRTTSSNRNRNRAYVLFKQFLDTDLFAIGGERPGDGDSTHANPTLTDPRCTSCHNVMDPVASAYKNWISFAGMGRPYYDPAPKQSLWDTSDILPAGFNGEVTPEGADALPWVAKKVVEDPRFARAMVKAVFQHVTGKKIIPPTVDGVNFQSKGYLDQQAFIGAVAQKFTDTNFDFKTMIKTLALSDYAIGIHTSEQGDLLMTPDQLNKKISAVLGQNWDNWLGTFSTLYGGVQSARSQQPNGANITIQLRMAEDMACRVTATDFSKLAANRLLLNGIEPTTTNESQIKQAIVDVYTQIIGKEFSVNDNAIVKAFEVHQGALALGQEGIANGSIPNRMPSECRVNTKSAAANKDVVDNDSQYQTRAWQAVIQFVLMDPRFFYL